MRFQRILIFEEISSASVIIVIVSEDNCSLKCWNVIVLYVQYCFNYVEQYLFSILIMMYRLSCSILRLENMKQFNATNFISSFSF